MFKNVNDAIHWIETSKRFTKRENLNNLKECLSLLGNPQDSYMSIHVAGTNGKGSTSCSIYSVLRQNKNLKVGLYTSPYIIKYNERIIFDGKYIADEDVLRIANYLYDFNEKFSINHEPLSFFELTTILSFIYFKEVKADIVVFEVGLGGILDSTNVINPLASIITSIDFDHMHILGNTLEEIALNKLGIVKTNNILFTVHNDKLDNLFNDYVNKKHSKISYVDDKKIENIYYDDYSHFRYKNIDYKTKLLGHHQINNACLVIDLINYLNSLKISKLGLYSIDMINNGLSNIDWPGRFEKFNNIILDGAHNIGAIKALINTLNELDYSNIKFLIGMMKDKDYKSVISEIDKISMKTYFTKIDYPRAEESNILYNCSKIDNKEYSDDTLSIYNKAISELKDNEYLVVTGSFYLVSYIRKLIK